MQRVIRIVFSHVSMAKKFHLSRQDS